VDDVVADGSVADGAVISDGGIGTKDAAAPLLDPKTIPDLLLWFSADQGVTVGAGQALTGWTNRVSGAALTTVSAVPPTLTAAAQNGLPLVAFGSGRTISGSIVAPVNLDIPGISVFTVTKTNAVLLTTTGRPFLLFGRALPDDMSLFQSIASFPEFYSIPRVGNAGGAGSWIGAVADTSYAPGTVQQVTYRGGMIGATAINEVRTNGSIRTPRFSTPFRPLLPTVQFMIGGNSGGVTDWSFYGSMGEVLIFRRTISDTETLSIEQYLKRRWATP